MILISSVRESKPYESKAFNQYFEKLHWGILDIETTGLRPDNSKFVLGGLLVCEKKSLYLKQFFSDCEESEEETLVAYLEEVSKLDFVVTYNGIRFDIPFLEGRCKSLRLDMPKMPYNFDLYRLVNKYSDLRSFLPNLKQPTVESFMGLWNQRTDEINGAQSVYLYYQYLNTGDEELKRQILLHNSDDVEQLHRLLPVIAKTDFHRAMFSMGFPAGPYHVSSVELKKDSLIIMGKQGENPIDYISFINDNHPFDLFFDASTEDFKIILPVINKGCSIIFLDLVALPFSFEELKAYPECAQDCLILKNYEEINYSAINRFIKLFLERLSEEVS